MRSKTLMSVLAVAVLTVPAIAAAAATTKTTADGSKAHGAAMHQRLVARDHTLAKRQAYLHHRHVKRGRWAIISTWSNRRLVRHIHKLRRHVLGPAANAAVRAKLTRIARCESHGNPRAVNSTGTYRGKYQMSMSTWRVAGGRGDPVAAPEWEQDRRAGIILRRYGVGQWPVCGYR